MKYSLVQSCVGNRLDAHTNLSLIYFPKLLQTGLNRLVLKSSKHITSTEHIRRTNRTLAASSRGKDKAWDLV